jgi:glycosyltransferase involved in cell wall biosynthesis
VIEPPIDTHRFAQPAPTAAEAAADVGARPLLVVSALVPYKRVELAVRAMQGRPERLIVVGEGPERERLMALAGPNVTFRGWVGDAELDALYAECRAVVHPAVDDFGMVMVEALAAGKPVVVSSEGGAREIVERDETGVFFDAPTVEALRTALDRLEARAAHFAPERLRAAARRFDTAIFQQRFTDAVARARVAREQPASGAEPANGTPARPHGSSGVGSSTNWEGAPPRTLTTTLGAVARARRHGKLREVA